MDLSVFEQDELLALGQEDFNKKDYTAALAKIKFIFSREKGPIEALALAGRIYATIGLFERAQQVFSDYIEQVPNAFIELFQLGMVEKDLGNYDKAIQTWEKVVEIEKNYPEALFYLGELCLGLARLEEGRNWLHRLLAIAPEGSEYASLAEQLLKRVKEH